MKVRVPVSIAGGSLLNAHNWVKSTIVKSNPGGSTDNYKIQSTDGTPLSLSDLTTQSFDEVFVLSGSRSNPGKAYPFPTNSYNYPTHDSRRLVGNDYAAILGKDVDASMVERLIAQNGVFSGLNTLTKLLYTIDSTHHTASDPDVAAIIQSYSNAQQKKGTRSNPGRPFFARGINDEFRGVLSPEEAVKAFVQDKYDIDLEGEKTLPFTTAIDKARIIRMYGLTEDSNLDGFLDNVLSPYLAISIANANFLRVLRSQDYYGEMQKYAVGTSRGRLEKAKGKLGMEAPKSGLVEDSLMWNKLVSLTPMTAKDFYEGKDFAFVANPYFVRQGIGEAMLTKKHVAELMEIVENHPTDALNTITGEIETSDGMLNRIFDIFSSNNNRVMWDVVAAQNKIQAEGDDPAEILKNLRIIFNSQIDEEKMAAAFGEIKLMSTNTASGILEYRRQVGGFRPTAPPFWPKPVVLSLMDVLRDNINLLIQKGDFHAGHAFLGLSHNAPKHDEEVKIPNKGKGSSFKIQYGRLEHLVNNFTMLSDQDIIAKFKDFGEDDKDGVDNVEPLTRLERKEFAGKVFDDDKNKQIIKHLVAGRDKEFVKKLGAVTKEQAQEFKSHAREALLEKSSSQESEPHKDVLSLLTLFMEIEEVSRNKYDYTMTENDRAFALYLLEMVFKKLLGAIKAAKGEKTAPDSPELMAQLQLLPHIINSVRGELKADNNLTEKDIQSRVSFEMHMNIIAKVAKHVLEYHEDVSKKSVETLIREKTGFKDGDMALPGWANKRFYDMTQAIRYGSPTAGGSEVNEHSESKHVLLLTEKCKEYKDWMQDLKANSKQPLGAPYLAHPEALERQIANLKDIKIVFDGGARISKDLNKQTDIILTSVKDSAGDSLTQIRKLYDVVEKVSDRYSDLDGDLNVDDILKGNRKDAAIQIQKVREHNLEYAKLSNDLKLIRGYFENTKNQLDDSRKLLQRQGQMRNTKYENMQTNASIKKFSDFIKNQKTKINELDSKITDAIEEIESETTKMTKDELTERRYPYTDSTKVKRFDAAYWRITEKLLRMMPEAYDLHKTVKPVSQFQTDKFFASDQESSESDIKPTQALLNKRRGSHKPMYQTIVNQLEQDFPESKYPAMAALMKGENKYPAMAALMKGEKIRWQTESKDGRVMALMLADKIARRVDDPDDTKPVEEQWEEYEQKMLDAEIARDDAAKAKLTEVMEKDLEKRVEKEVQEHIDQFVASGLEMVPEDQA